MRLERIPAEEFAAFIDGHFQRSGVKPEAGLGAAIVDLAGNLPYDVQRLAHETWDEVRMGGRRRATLEDLHQALRRLLAEQHTLFEASWQRLTLPQRSVLRAVVLEEGRELLSADDARSAPPRGRVDGAIRAHFPAPGRSHQPRKRPLHRRRLAAARMGRAPDVLSDDFTGGSRRTRPTYRICA